MVKPHPTSTATTSTARGRRWRRCITVACTTHPRSCATAVCSWPATSTATPARDQQGRGVLPDAQPVGRDPSPPWSQAGTRRAAPARRPRPGRVIDSTRHGDLRPVSETWTAAATKDESRRRKPGVCPTKQCWRSSARAPEGREVRDRRRRVGQRRHGPGRAGPGFLDRDRPGDGPADGRAYFAGATGTRRSTPAADREPTGRLDA